MQSLDKGVVRLPLACRASRDGASRNGECDTVFIFLTVYRTRDPSFVKFLELASITQDPPGNSEDEVEKNGHSDNPADEGRIERHAALCVRLRGE